MTDVELSKLLIDLEDTGRKLNEASTHVNSIILTCEQKIRSANLGIEIWLKEPVDLSDNVELEEQAPVGEARLGFARIQNNWCLAVKLYASNRFQNAIALLQAPRKVRMGAVLLLPTLVQSLNSQARSRLAAIEAASKLVG